jgi:hypothetical protein
VSYASPERRGHHSLVGAYSTLANNFLIRKVKTKHEKYQNTPNDTLSYTKYPFENTKIPPKVKLFFFLVFSKVKNILLLCIWKVEKPEIPLSNNSIFV